MRYRLNIPKDTLITCYNCKDEVGKFVKEVKKGQFTNGKDLINPDGEDMCLRSSMVCLNCGKHYVKTDGFSSITEIHTSEGWIS